MIGACVSQMLSFWVFLFLNKNVIQEVTVGSKQDRTGQFSLLVYLNLNFDKPSITLKPSTLSPTSMINFFMLDEYGRLFF